MSLTGSLTPNRLHIHPRHPYDGHNRWKHVATSSQTHNADSLHVFLNCSFGYSKDRADVTGHGLCTSYVRDSCEKRGPCQQTHLLLQDRKKSEPLAKKEVLHKDKQVNEAFSFMSNNYCCQSNYNTQNTKHKNKLCKLNEEQEL